MTIFRWALALTLALFFLFMGGQKLGTDNVIFATIAERSGVAMFEPYIRIITGIAEIMVALMLMVPKQRSKGARIALLILLGAIGFHISPWLGINVEGMGNGLFILAVGAFVLTCAVLFLEMLARK